jgi:hypothetical protein
MLAKDLDDTLKTIAARAKELRDAGVVGRVTIGDIAFELDAPEPQPAVTVQLSDKGEVDPLKDPDTFGTDGVPKRRKPFSHDAARAEFEEE